MIDVKKVFEDSLRLYFAPLVGALKAVMAEIKRFEREHVS